MPPARLDGFCRVRVGVLAMGEPSDEERRVVAPRRRRRGDPSGPGTEEVGAQRAVTEDAREGGAAADEVGADVVGEGHGSVAREEDAALFVGLADGGLDEGARELGRMAKALAPCGGIGADPARDVEVVRPVDAAAGEHGHPAREGHARDPALEEHLQRGAAVGGAGASRMSTTVAAGFGTTGALVTLGP